MNEASMNHSESHPARVNLSAEKNVQDWKVRLKHHSRNEIVLEAQRTSYPPCKRVESMPNLSHSVTRTSKIWSWMECASQMILSGPEVCNSQCKKRTSKEQAQPAQHGTTTEITESAVPTSSRHFPAAYLFTFTAPSGCAKHHKPKLTQNRPDRAVGRNIFGATT